MSDKPSRTRIIEAAFLLKNKDYADVSVWMLAKEKRTAHVKRDPLRAEVTRNGRKVKGGKNKHEPIDWHNPDVVYTELPSQFMGKMKF